MVILFLVAACAWAEAGSPCFLCRAIDMASQNLMAQTLSPQRLRTGIMSIHVLWSRSTLLGSYQPLRIYTGDVRSSYSTESSSPSWGGDPRRRIASMSITDA